MPTDPAATEVVITCKTAGFGAELIFGGEVSPVQPDKIAAAINKDIAKRIPDEAGKSTPFSGAGSDLGMGVGFRFLKVSFSFQVHGSPVAPCMTYSVTYWSASL
jgi:hypothetical protein